MGWDGTAPNFRPVSNVRSSMNYHLKGSGDRYDLLKTLTNSNANAMVTAIAQFFMLNSAEHEIYFAYKS